MVLLIFTLILLKNKISSVRGCYVEIMLHQQNRKLEAMSGLEIVNKTRDPMVNEWAREVLKFKHGH